MRHVPAAGGDGTTFVYPGASGGAVAAGRDDDGVAVAVDVGVVCGEEVAVGATVGADDDPPALVGAADGFALVPGPLVTGAGPPVVPTVVPPPLHAAIAHANTAKPNERRNERIPTTISLPTDTLLQIVDH